jgi:serine/threonine protein kinase
MTPERIGSYHVQASIGAGGMGEVYRARDTKLGRDVAIKIMSRLFTSDSERLARFEREARVLAALNHPNICAIYGVEDAEGIPALVLELVDGETLADRIARGPVPLKETLNIARQIADALDAAHEKGIVHRDLKPANVKITTEGVVKVLDFGLAKGASTDATAADATQSAAETADATRAGIILGTVSYMSPEQARGQKVDKRTDIWAFGCVLYEMLAGRAAFGRETVSDAIVAILEHEPNWQALSAGIPANLRRLVERCLQKDVRQRLRDIGDVHDYLVPLATASETVHPRWRPVEFQRLTDDVGINESPAISPDGKMVAFVAVANGRRQIWIRLLTGGTPLQVTRDDADHQQPRWAPDSSTLIFHRPSETPGGEGTLWEVSALGGLPRPIVGALSGGDISHDGSRIALLRAHQGQVVLTTVARDGSDARTVAPVPRGHVWRSPRWSHDDAWLAFHGGGVTVWDDFLCVVPVRGGEPRPIARAAFMRGVAWLPDKASLVYSSSAGSTVPYPPTFNLRVVDFDGSTDTQITSGDVSFAEPDVHQSGRLVVCRLRSESDIWKCPVDASALENTRAAAPVTRQTGQVQTPSVSPDGSELVYLSDNGGHANLWVIRTDGTRARQITFERDRAVTIGVPQWSPAGNEIAYVVSREYPQLWLIRPDGRGARKLVERGVSACWSEDGQWLYYTSNVDGQGYCIEKVPVTGGPPVVVRGDHSSHAPTAGRGVLYFAAFVAPHFGSLDCEIRRASPDDGPAELLSRIDATRLAASPLYVHPALSRDGRWLALGLTDGAITNLWTLSTSDGSWRQVTDFGEQPTIIARQVSWSPDGQHLYAAIGKHNGDIVMLTGLV